MKAYVIQPLDPAFTLSPAVLKDYVSLGANDHFITTCAPIVLASERDIPWQSKALPCLELRVECPKSGVREASMKLRAQFFSRKKTDIWGLRAEISLSLTGATGHQIRSLKVSGKPINLDQEQREVHFKALRDSLRTAFNHAGEIPKLLIEGMEIHANRVDHICEEIEAGVLEVIDGQNRDKDIRAQTLADRLAALDALPDGTPLQFRRPTNPRYWQLTIKRDRVDRQSVHHLRVLPPEYFRSDEAKLLGLSAHDILPLFAAAKAAMEVADPIIHNYGPVGGNSQLHQLFERTPLHSSFHETKDVQARRRTAPKIWMQTTIVFHRNHYATRDGKSAPLHAYRTGPRNPCFVSDGCPEELPSLIQRRGSSRDAIKPIPDFGAPGGFYLVSPAALSVLREHNTGATEFRPIRVEDHDGTPIDGPWHVIVMREPVSSVMHERCDKTLLSNLAARSVRPYEIHIDGSAHGDLDFWFDPSVSPKSFFFSDRLLKALKKANAAPKLGLKPCEVH